MKVIPTGLPGVLLLEPKVFGDARGFFMETWQAARYHEAGMPGATTRPACRSVSSRITIPGRGAVCCAVCIIK